jgi:hypothetical protein
MKRKFLLLLLTFTAILCVTFGFAACGETTSSGSTETEKEPQHTHILTLHAATEATCTTAGNTAYYTCNGCDKWFSDSAGATEIADHTSVTIVQLGHDYATTFTVDKEATCSEVGSQSKHCSRCDSTTEVTTIEKIAHTYQDGACSACQQRQPTEGLEYTISNDGKYYTVKGIGTTTDTNIVIASEYNNLPVTYIDSSAFKNCSKLTSVTIPDSVTSIGYDAFEDCSSLTSVTIGNGVTSIGSYAFYECGSLSSVYYSGDVAGWCNIAFSGYNSNPLSYAHNLYINNQLVTDLVIPDSVISIGNYAFYNCSSLTSVTIGNSVTSIGILAFLCCSSLTNITIPDSVTSIGGGAFEGCSSLTSVYYAGDVVGWCNIAFSDAWTNPLYYAHNLYINNELVTDLVIPDGVTSIGNYAFYNCSRLTSVTIPDSVTSIGSSAFYGCSGLTSVYYTGDVAGWCNIAFSSNPLFYAQNLYINNQLVTGDLVIPDSVTSIGNYAFYNCSRLTSVTIPDSVTSIGSSAFYGCSSLTSITIPDSVKSIDWYAFYNCSSLTSVTIPDNVTSIGYRAFYGCKSLTSITIPDNVTSIGYQAFYNCSSLKIVYYKGTAEEWAKISIDENFSGNKYLTSATRYYYSETEPTESGNYWHYDTDGVTPVVWKKES